MANPISKKVNEEIHALYALLAHAAAKKAVARVEMFSDADGAADWAGHAETWLIRAGADATRWNYSRPRVG